MKSQSTHFFNLVVFFVTVLLLVNVPLFVSAQTSSGVAIGDSIQAADASAILDLFSTEKGFLPPRMTTAERDSISAPATGLVVYDTDFNRLLYFNNGWQNFGHWTKVNSNAYPGTVLQYRDRVALGNMLGDSSQLVGATLSVLDSSGIGIISSVVTTAAQQTPRHMFNAAITDGGNFSMNFLINTVSTGSTDGATLGAASFVESESSFSGGFGGMALYTGSGGNVAFIDSLPVTIGMSGDAAVLDSTKAAMAIGASFEATSSQTGMNIGLNVEAFSTSTYANIGVWASVNDGDDGFIFEDSFSTRFTVAGLFENTTSGSTDYNILAGGDAKSYFGGNVGIGILNPTVALDVIGAVNADAFLINGSPIAALWDSSVGIIFPAGSTGRLSVTSTTAAIIDSYNALAVHGPAYMKDTSSSLPNLKWYFDAPTTHEWKVLATFDNAGDSTTSSISVNADNGNIDIGVHGENYDNNLSVDVNAGFKFEMGDGDFDISSTTGAFFPPRMTATQASALTEVNGMMIYVTGTDSTFTTIGFWGYENGSWVDL